MEEQQAAHIFEALSFEVRLALLRLLVLHAPNGLVAGDIARELRLAPSKLSFHLKATAGAGLISVEKQGRFLRYRANIPLMRDAAAYLTEASRPPRPARQQRQDRDFVD